jgi:hypothetical protein
MRTIIDSTGNFLIRSANLFLQHGLNVMMADAALAYPSGMNLSDRLSLKHAGELQDFINAAHNRWGKPVWVVGTSNGSVSAVTAAGFNPPLSGLRGVVLTSTDEFVVDHSADIHPVCLPHHGADPRRLESGRSLHRQPTLGLGGVVCGHSIEQQGFRRS